MPERGDRITFRGVFFDDHWEYDAPAVLYAGAHQFGIGGNAGKLDEMIENAAMDWVDGHLKSGWHDSDLREFKARGWSTRGFAKRKGEHIEVVVVATGDPCDKYAGFKVISRRAAYGRGLITNAT